MTSTTKRIGALQIASVSLPGGPARGALRRVSGASDRPRAASWRRLHANNASLANSEKNANHASSTSTQRQRIHLQQRRRPPTSRRPSRRRSAPRWTASRDERIWIGRRTATTPASLAEDAPTGRGGRAIAVLFLFLWYFLSDYQQLKMSVPFIDPVGQWSRSRGIIYWCLFSFLMYCQFREFEHNNVFLS